MRKSVCLILVRSLTAVDRLHQSFCLHLPQPDFDNFAVYIRRRYYVYCARQNLGLLNFGGWEGKNFAPQIFDGFLPVGGKHHRSSNVTWHHCEECT